MDNTVALVRVGDAVIVELANGFRTYVWFKDARTMRVTPFGRGQSRMFDVTLDGGVEEIDIDDE